MATKAHAHSTLQFCSDLGGYLSETETIEEHEIVSNLGFNANSYLGFDSMGQSDPHDYIWRHSGNKVADGFTCWHINEPNGVHERCGNIYLHLIGHSANAPNCSVGVGWNDIPCDVPRSAFCEKDPVKPFVGLF